MHTDRSVLFIMKDTREYIIEEAYKLFLSRSYEAVSISDISKAIGLTKGALYHHFTNKEELFKAVIDKYLILNEMILWDQSFSLQQLMSFTVEKSAEIVNKLQGEQQVFIPITYMALIIDAFRHYPGFASEKEQLLIREVEKIKEIMDRAIMNGEIRKDINTEIMATNYYSITIGLAQNLLHNSSPKIAISALQEQLAEFYKVLKI